VSQISDRLDDLARATARADAIEDAVWAQVYALEYHRLANASVKAATTAHIGAQSMANKAVFDIGRPEHIDA
jgi:hypothetical protein